MTNETMTYGYWTKHEVETQKEFANRARCGEWDRLKKVLSDFRKTFKAVARINVMSCCRGCAEIKTKDELQTILWHFGGQGNRIVGDDDVNAMYFNHENFTQQHFEWLQVELNKAGIGIVWNGSQSECIEIVFNDAELLTAYGIATTVTARKVKVLLDQEKKAQEQFKKIAEAWNFESAWV